MVKRKAFTLIELLVVMSIILILMGLLLPAIIGAWHSSQITAQKLDFQTIATALDRYKADFGDYPRNTALANWDTSQTPSTPPIFTSLLATALIGPGPAVTSQLSNGLTEMGDGNDGLGTRAATQNFPDVLSGSVGMGSTTVSVNNPWQLWSSTNPNVGKLSASIDLSPGMPTEEVIGVNLGSSAMNTAAGGPYTLALLTPAQQNHNSTDPVVLKVAYGNVWSNYLPADHYNIIWVDNTGYGISGNTPPPSKNQQNVFMPVLLDHWGTPIQFFTRFGPNSNRYALNNTNLTPGGTNPVVGPLYGFAANKTVDRGSVLPANGVYAGYNSIWDARDAAVVKSINGTSLPTAQQWVVTASFDPTSTFKWMLGDDDLDDYIEAPTNNPETLRCDGPYILISAGPNALFCDISKANVKPETFRRSGNIYNFDR